MMILPLAIGALAILITLCYASYLDIIDRRVPFVTWVPMLVVGIPAAALSFLYMNGGLPLLLGYCGIAAGVILVIYFNDRNITSCLHLILPSGIIIFELLLGLYFLTLNLPALALVSGIGSVILLVASVIEFHGRENPFIDLWPLVFFVLISSGWLYVAIQGGTPIYAYIGFIAVFCTLFYLFGILRLFGGADAWALVFITLCIPFFPFEPITGYPPLGFFPFTVLVNAVIFNLAAPVGLFVVNIVRGNRAPLRYLFLGYPVHAEQLPGSFGFVMEEMGMEDGVLTRRFIGVRESLGSMVRGKKRVYTKDLRLHPQQYTEETALYKKAGTVWISYGIPFIVPITAGMIFGLCVGDILVICLNAAGGL